MSTVMQDLKAALQYKVVAKPPVIVMYGQCGIGKTLFGAAAPKPIFLRDAQEDGINTLKNAGLVAEDVPVMPVAESWEELFIHLSWLASEENDHKTLVVDTVAGLERLCAEYVCRREFKSQWGEKGFGGFGRGWEACVPEWRKLINAFDDIRTKRTSTIILLAHSQIKTQKNPEGPDYDRYIPELHHKLWACTAKWADIILFANSYVQVDDSGLRVKAKGGIDRYMYPTGCAAYEAKNRHGLTEEISMGTSGREAWANLISAIKEAKEKNNA
jgi:hypothetical protein